MFESTLVKIPHCWKSHEVAQLYLVCVTVCAFHGYYHVYMSGSITAPYTITHIRVTLLVFCLEQSKTRNIFKKNNRLRLKLKWVLSC